MLGIFEKRRQRLAENLAVAEGRLADVQTIIAALNDQINCYEEILFSQQQEIVHTYNKPPRLTVRQAPERLIGRAYEPATAAIVFHYVNRLLAATHQEHQHRVNGRYETRDELKGEAKRLTARIAKLRAKLNKLGNVTELPSVEKVRQNLLSHPATDTPLEKEDPNLTTSTQVFPESLRYRTD